MANQYDTFTPNKEKQIAFHLKKLSKKGKYYSRAKAAIDLGIAPGTVEKRVESLGLDLKAVMDVGYRENIDKLKKFLRNKKVITKAALKNKISGIFGAPFKDLRYHGTQAAQLEAKARGATASDIWEKIKERHPEVVPKDLKVKLMSEEAGGKAFEEWLREKLKGRKTPFQIQNTFKKDLVEASGIGIRSATAHLVLKRNPELAEKIEWKYSKGGKGGPPLTEKAYNEPHSTFKKWWLSHPNYGKDDFDKTPIKRKHHAYTQFIREEKRGTPPKGFIIGQEFAEKMDISPATLRGYVHESSVNRPANYIYEKYTPKLFNGVYYFKDPTVYETRAWNKFRYLPKLDPTCPL